jgi:hypothetical protein
VEVLHHLFLWLWDMWPRKYNFTRIKKNEKIKENRIFVNVGDDDDPPGKTK